MFRRYRLFRTTLPTAVGVAVGGHVVDDSIVTFAPFLHWDGATDLGTMVTEATGLPCGVFNDIDSLLVDASWFGPGVGVDMFAVVTIGVGVGYSLAVNGKPVQYPDKSYGLVGHVLIDPEGPRCTSGHIGCSQCLTDDSIAEQYSAIVGRAVSFEDFARDAKERAAGHAVGEPDVFPVGIAGGYGGEYRDARACDDCRESAFLAKLGTDSLRDGIRFYRHSQTQPVKFTIMNHDWQLWAKAAASRVIVKHIG